MLYIFRPSNSRYMLRSDVFCRESSTPIIQSPAAPGRAYGKVQVVRLSKERPEETCISNRASAPEGALEDPRMLC
jgi:hypothetical protein